MMLSARGFVLRQTLQDVRIRFTQFLLYIFLNFLLMGSSNAMDSSEKRCESNAVSQIRSVSREVYRLLVDFEGGTKGGTAFLISGHRIVATNNHVIDGGSAYWLGYIDKGHIRRMPLRLIASYPQKDLALLETLDDLPGEPLPLSTQNPEAPTDLFAIGFPAAADTQGALSDDENFYIPSVLKGYVSRVLSNRSLPTQLQHQTPIVPGYSGGPLISNDGTVLGISTSIHKDANGISFGVLASDLAELAEACSLPVRANQIAERPKDDRNTSFPLQETLNTYALQHHHPLFASDKRATLLKAEKLLQEGSINASRLLCQHLLRSHPSSEAFECLARTYDQIILNKYQVIGVSGDDILAQHYYAEALSIKEHTSELLSTRMENTRSVSEGLCDGSLCRLIDQGDGPRVFCQRRAPN
jgi:hypothetical protein